MFLVQGGYLVQWESAQRRVSAQGGAPAQALPPPVNWSGTPPPCGQTDACKFITLPQTSFAGGNDLAGINSVTKQ